MHFRFNVVTLALLLPAVHSIGFCASAELDKVNVFTAGQDEYQFYGIPAIVTASDGTLLAFCEGQESSRSDDGDIDMLLRRSQDGGETWLPIQVLAEEGGDAPIKFGNPCPVVDSQTGTIWLTMNRSTGKDRNQRGGGHIFVMSSRDHGITWSKSRDVTGQVKKSNWKHYAQGPGVHTAWMRRAEFDRVQTRKTLAPFFRPPAEYAADLGEHRSPLDGADGKRVTNRAEWQQRRQQILAEWHKLLGPWPPPLKKRRIRYLKDERERTSRNIVCMSRWRPATSSRKGIC